MNNNGIWAAKWPCSESQIKGNDGKITEKWKLQYRKCRKCLDFVTQCPSKTKLGATDIKKTVLDV